MKLINHPECPQPRSIFPNPISQMEVGYLDTVPVADFICHIRYLENQILEITNDAYQAELQVGILRDDEKRSLAYYEPKLESLREKLKEYEDEN